ncbi:hypothetical protein MPER_04267, partial [Moniliophthora perniciosa FA553]
MQCAVNIVTYWSLQVRVGRTSSTHPLLAFQTFPDPAMNATLAPELIDMILKSCRDIDGQLLLKTAQVSKSWAKRSRHYYFQNLKFSFTLPTDYARAISFPDIIITHNSLWCFPSTLKEVRIAFNSLSLIEDVPGSGRRGFRDSLRDMRTVLKRTEGKLNPRSLVVAIAGSGSLCTRLDFALTLRNSFPDITKLDLALEIDNLDLLLRF